LQIGNEDKVCERSARFKTRIGHHWYCQDCYTIYLNLHPKERKYSKGEQECMEVLQDMGVTFTQQFTLKSLGKKKFDFYFEFKKQKFLLEYDGSPHFQYVPYFHRTEEKYLLRKEVDVLKTTTAIAEDYFIIRIDHTCFESIQDNLLNALSKFDDIIENVFISKNCYFSNTSLYNYIIDNLSM
jgi:hypothetical protein